MPASTDVLRETLDASRTLLREAWSPAGSCVGRLSGSALSTATAATALWMAHRAEADETSASLARAGIQWIVEHQNADGGWGDTIDSPSNISTTALCWVAVGLDEAWRVQHHLALERATEWLEREVGSSDVAALAQAITERYGDDRTFSVPILTMAALGGRLGEGRDAWRAVIPLPFEVAVLPFGFFQFIGLPTVSYALPALIAMGQARHHHAPSRNPLVRWIRERAKARTLRLVENIQPESGGFLEAAPLTSFVSMCLISCGHHDGPVVRRGLDFLRRTVRDDGCWPIDTNLDTWTTSLAVHALHSGGTTSPLDEETRSRTRRWLRQQQYRVVHPYTRAAPGGWAWTDLTGGVPDADDTPGALLALKALGAHDVVTNARDDEASRTLKSDQEKEEDLDSAIAGVKWLLDLQNRDGGIPTFCRGWGKLPFDRSSPDLTAHAIRAFLAWRGDIAGELGERLERGITAAFKFLMHVQRADGAWIPLWFGNQEAPAQENPLYGTTRVLCALAQPAPDASLQSGVEESVRRATRWILDARDSSGGWGGAAGVAPSIEETALAVEALATLDHPDSPLTTDVLEAVRDAIAAGTHWLTQATREGTHFPASPIGLYFAKLWYSEQLYPLLFTVSALERVAATTSSRT